MNCTQLLRKVAYFSAAFAFVASVCSQSFAGIIVTPVLRSTTQNATTTTLVVDIYGQGSGGASQQVGAFGVQVSLTGAGTRSAFSVTAPAAVNVAGLNSFRELTNVSTTSATGASPQTFNFTRSRFIAGSGIFPENVTISGGAIPANFAAQEANRLIGTITFNVDTPGAYIMTTSAIAVPDTGNPGQNLGTGFLVGNNNATFDAVAGGTTFNTGLFSIAVPEPSSIALLACGGLVGGFLIRRKVIKSKAVA